MGKIWLLILNVLAIVKLRRGRGGGRSTRQNKTKQNVEEQSLWLYSGLYDTSSASGLNVKKPP